MKLVPLFGSFFDNMKNHLHSFTHPPKTPDDGLTIAYASALLQISEFRFFHLAHIEWFGKDIPDRRMESFFCEYLFANNIPFWVRNLSRKVLSLHKQGSLSPGDFGIKRHVPTPEMRTKGKWIIAMLLMLVAVFCFLISGFEPF
jgi:hypothetical protein